MLQNYGHATKGVMSMLKTSGFKYATIEATNAFTSKVSVTSVVEFKGAEVTHIIFLPIISTLYFFDMALDKFFHEWIKILLCKNVLQLVFLVG